MGIPLSDTGKSMVKTKPEGHPLIIKLLLSLWLLYKNYINYYYLFKDNIMEVIGFVTGQWLKLVLLWAETPDVFFCEM